MITANIIMLKFVNKLFKSGSDKQIKSFQKTIDLINQFEENISKLTDLELKEKTLYFKTLLSKDSSLDDILPEVFFFF